MEREVSLASGCHLVEILDRSRYEIHPIEIGGDGKWYLHHMDSPMLASAKSIGAEVRSAGAYTPPAPAYSELVTARVMRNRIDVLFLALHGPGGEDGTIQGFLETLDIPYVGSGVLASALTMDKGRCKTFLRASALPTPEWLFFQKSDWEKRSEELADRIRETFPEGYIVKANDQGSSIGTTKVPGGEDPHEAIGEALRYSPEILIEKTIVGRELTCGVYGSENPEALPVTEIKTPSGFFDYTSKYQPGGAEEITPADVPEGVAKEIQSLSVRAHRLFGCEGITRSDFMLEDDRPTVIEVNTIPGMTRMSLIPRACEAAGLEFETILDRVIGEALFRDELAPVA
jgi:D-alanine-D-alanine ligase